MNKILIIVSSLAVLIAIMIHNSVKVGNENNVIDLREVANMHIEDKDEGGYLTNVNDAELELSIKYPGAAIKVKECTNKALLKTYELFESKSAAKGNGDAFRHCYWNILMVKYIGLELATEFAFAHEYNSPDGVDKEMDLSNNQKAREWALNLLDASDDEIVEFVLRRVEFGDLVRIVKQNGVEVLVPTDCDERIELD